MKKFVPEEENKISIEKEKKKNTYRKMYRRATRRTESWRETSFANFSYFCNMYMF